MREDYPRYDFILDYKSSYAVSDNYYVNKNLAVGIKELAFFASTILFMPKIEDIHTNWYPEIPLPEDNVKLNTKQDVRKWILMAEGNFVVMPADELSGKEKVIPYEHLKPLRWKEDDMIVIFFVSKKDFKEYIRIVNLIGKREKRSIHFSVLQKYPKMYNFIKEKIVESSYLTENQLQDIRRTRLDNGSVVPKSLIEYWERLKKETFLMNKSLLEIQESILGLKEDLLDDLAVEGLIFQDIEKKDEALYKVIINLESKIF
jgi:hypothetical protein